MTYIVVFEEDVCPKALDDVKFFIRRNCKKYGGDLQDNPWIECSEEMANDIEEMYGVEQVVPIIGG